MSTTFGQPDPLLAWRTRFPSLERTLHFASHTLGAMPAEAADDLAEYARTWADRGIRAWEERWLGLVGEVTGSLESLLGAANGSISPHPNVTVAEAVALSCVDFTPARPKLVCTDEDFPSVLYLYEGLVRRGAEIVRVRAHEGRRVLEDEIVAAIDERTAVVAISTVLFRTAQVLDLDPIVCRARAVGALTLLDAYQGAGTLEMDLGQLDPDFVTGGSVKWLCGGPGTGWLYVRPSLAPRLAPALTGWFGHAEPFTFDSGPTRLHDGERRFWNGTPCIPACTAARAGFAIAAEIGSAAIREKSLRQTARILELADAAGFRVGSPREALRRGGTVCLDVPEAARVCAALLARDVLLDFRPGVGLRLAPHYYTRDDEVDEVMGRVREEVERVAGAAR
jgi:kynureninase